MKISLNNPINKIQKTEKGYLVNGVKENFLVKKIVICAGKGVEKFSDTKIKTSYAPIAVVEGLNDDAISFVEECRIAENLENLKVVVHDVTKLLDFNSEFDLIYSNLVLQFFDLNQLGAIFDNINKIMQKNSLFLFSTKKPGDKYHNFGTKINDDTFEYNRIKRYFFDQDSLRTLLEKNFKILIFDSAQHENLDKSVSKWWKILVQKK